MPNRKRAAVKLNWKNPVLGSRTAATKKKCQNNFTPKMVTEMCYKDEEEEPAKCGNVIRKILQWLTGLNGSAAADDDSGCAAPFKMTNAMQTKLLIWPRYNCNQWLPHDDTTMMNDCNVAYNN